jgi:hypothetical protein
MKNIRAKLPPLKKRPQSPRNLYRGRKYIPPKLVDCLSILDAIAKLKEQGFVVAKTTANFYQHKDGRTAVVQIVHPEGIEKSGKVQLYIRGNQENQI